MQTVQYSKLDATTDNPDTHIREPEQPQTSRIRKFCWKSTICSISLLLIIGIVLYMFQRWDDHDTDVFNSLLNGPVCSNRTLEYEEYVTRHGEFVNAMTTNCSAAFEGDIPRILVHDCTTNCSGLGDRIGKMAGFLQFALLTNRFVFFNQHNPNVSDWLQPVDFDWRYTGKVRECLDRVKQRAVDSTDHLHQYVHIDPQVTEEEFYRIGPLRSRISRLLQREDTDPLSRSPTQPILFIDTNVNNIRPYQLLLDFPMSSKQSALLPHVSYRDDASDNLYTGCLLARLFTFGDHITNINDDFLNEQNLSRDDHCIIGLHYRFGDSIMFHFNGTVPEGAATDHRINIDHLDTVVQRAVTCAAEQALIRCPVHLLGRVGVFVASDSPRFTPLIEQHFASTQQRFASVANLTLLMTPSATPTHTSTFSDLGQTERHIAEEHLFRDYSMLASSRGVITTGSTFSFTAASFALSYPVDAGTCRVRWW